MAGAGNDIQQQIDQLGPWFHNLHLPDGTQTAPKHYLGDFPNKLWQRFAAELPSDLSGCSVLDIGCNAGFYSFKLAQRGAQVLAVDHDAHYLQQATWAAEQYGLADRIHFEQRDVYQLAELEQRFDLVLFMGVFYHLRYPLLGLDIVAERVGRSMVFQTLEMPGPRGDASLPENLPIDQRERLTADDWPRMAFIEHRLQDDPTNWWAANPAAVEAMLRSTGLRVVGQPAAEIYLCEAPPEGAAACRSWNSAERHLATHARRG